MQVFRICKNCGCELQVSYKECPKCKMPYSPVQIETCERKKENVKNGIIETEEYVYKEAFGGCEIIKIKCVENSRCIIPEKIDGLSVRLINKYAFDLFKLSIKELILPKTLFVLDNENFRGLSNLEYVEMDCDLQNIGQYTFADCINLRSINIGSRIESIEEYAFLIVKDLAEL